jgi:hypothetical protein
MGSPQLVAYAEFYADMPDRFALNDILSASRSPSALASSPTRACSSAAPPRMHKSASQPPDAPVGTSSHDAIAK